jgi:hypothetical protein
MNTRLAWFEAGCRRACQESHTYRWGACAYAIEPGPTLSRFELARSEDGEMSGFYESMDADQVAAWLREQGYTVTKEGRG